MLDRSWSPDYIDYMNKLSPTDRAGILQLLCEGMAIRAIERTTGHSKHTISSLLNDAGAALGAYQDAAFRNLKSEKVQVDEIWSFTYAKAKNVASAKAAPEGAGDTWTWTAIDADTKLVFSVLIGARHLDHATEFMHDIRSRLANRVQLTTDGHRPYLLAVREAFGADVDYAMLVKMYGATTDGRGSASSGGRYSPAALTGISRRRITG